MRIYNGDESALARRVHASMDARAKLIEEGDSRDPLEDVVHEGVDEGHGLGGDAGVGVDLLHHSM